MLYSRMLCEAFLLFPFWTVLTVSWGPELGGDFWAGAGRWKVLDALPMVAVGCGPSEDAWVE